MKSMKQWRSLTAPSRLREWWVALAVVLVAVPGSFAQSKKPPARLATESQRIAERFLDRLSEVDSLLRVGRAKPAYRLSGDLVDEMIERSTGSPKVGEFLGVGLTLRALAAVQLGRKDEGLWHWHVAMQLFPDVERRDLKPYGDAGVILRDNPARKEAESAKDGVEADPSVSPPRKKKAPKPRFPAGRLGAGSVDVVVECVIGADGRPREPVIIETQGELSLVAAVLESLRRWEFEPARKDGEAIPAYYNLTARFWH